MTPLLEKTLRRLQSQFESEVTQGQRVAALLVHYPMPAPVLDFQELARIAGNLPPLGDPEAELLACRLWGGSRLERDGRYGSNLWLWGDATALQRFRVFSNDVCRAICLNVDPLDWARCLFVLAWKRIRGSSFHADRWTVRCGVRIGKPDKPPPAGHSFGRCYQDILDGAEPFTASALPDLFAASVQALDLYLTGAVPPPTFKTKGEITENTSSYTAFSLLDRYPATPSGHLSFLEFVRDELHNAAEAKRHQSEQQYGNQTIESMIGGIKWPEAQRRVDAMHGLFPDTADQVARVLIRELNVGTVERLDELLVPAVQSLRDTLEDSRNRKVGLLSAGKPGQGKEKGGADAVASASGCDSKGRKICKVFISYSHDSPEHCKRVLQLAEALRDHGIDAELDQYHVRPPEGWPQWCEKQLRPENSDFVLMICTETYCRRIENRVHADEGRGVFWEGGIIYNYIYDAKGNTRFIPVLLSGATVDCIPLPVRNHTRYQIGQFDLMDEGFQGLYRELTKQPGVTKPALGQVVPLGPHPVPAAPLDSRPVETTFPTLGTDVPEAKAELKAALDKMEHEELCITIPYDPANLEQMQRIQDKHENARQSRLRQLRLHLYRAIFPWFAPEIEKAVNTVPMVEIEAAGERVCAKADAAWKNVSGFPPLTQWRPLDWKKVGLLVGYDAKTFDAAQEEDIIDWLVAHFAPTVDSDEEGKEG